jgi:hypothetical protein
MTDRAEILERLRRQRIEVAGLAADEIERLVASEAEARAKIAELEQVNLMMLQHLITLQPMMKFKFNDAKLARQMERADARP